MDRVIQQTSGNTRARKLALCLGISLLILLAGYLVVVGFSPAVPTYYPVTAHSTNIKVSGRATIVPERIGVIAALNAGTVVEQRASVGDKLKQGDVLVVLQSVSLAADLADAEQQLELSRAQEKYAKADLLDEALSRKSQVSENEQKLHVAQAKAQAESKLMQAGAVSKLELSTAQSQAALARTLYLSSVKRLKQLHAAQTAKRAMLATKRRLAADTVARLKREKAALTIRAAHAGWLTKLDVKPGEHVTAGSPIAEVMGNDLYADIQVAQADAATVTPGAKVRLSSSLGTIAATVQSVMPRAADDGVHVKARLDGRPAWLRADMNLNADIDVGGDATGLFVRAAPHFLPNTTQRVRRRSHGKASLVLIRFGRRVGQQVTILEGAAAGDQISALGAGND